MKLEVLKISDIVPDPTNPNFMNEEMMERLRFSIKKFGYTQPILIDEKNVILDGEHRWRAAKAEGRTDIEIIRIDGLTEAQKKLLRQAMNKLHGQHDPLKDATDFKFMMSEGEREDLKMLLALNDDELDTYTNLLAEPETMPADIESDGSAMFNLVFCFPISERDAILNKFKTVPGKDNEQRFMKLLEAVK